MTTSPQNRISLFEFMPYGAPELKEVARKYLVRATIFGSAMWIALFVLSFGSVQILKHAPKETSVRISRFMTASWLPPRMLKIVVAM